MVWREEPFDEDKVFHGKGSLGLGIPEGFHLASPIDRLAAVSIDALLFTPIVVLALTPLKRSFFLLNQLQEESPIWQSYALGLGISLLTIVVLQTICLYYFGSTPGKKALKLEVISLTKEPMTFFQSFLRSFFWALESVFFLGAAFLEAFTHKHRRPFHDRVADTIVVTKKKVSNGNHINFQEYFLSRLFINGCLIFSFVFIITMFQFYSSHWEIGQVQNKNLCAKITNIIKIHSEELKSDQRLSLAMSLYAANQLDVECLEQEVNVAINQKKGSKDLAYFSKALIHDSESDLVMKYLKKVCQVNKESDNCVLSNIFIDRIEGKFDKIREKFSQIHESTLEHIRVWEVQYLMNQGNYKMASHLLSSFSKSPWLSHFVGENQVLALWKQGDKEKSSFMAQVLMGGWSKNRREGLSSLICLQKLEENCSALKEKFCRFAFLQEPDEASDEQQNVYSPTKYQRQRNQKIKEFLYNKKNQCQRALSKHHPRTSEVSMTTHNQTTHNRKPQSYGSSNYNGVIRAPVRAPQISFWENVFKSSKSSEEQK